MKVSLQSEAASAATRRRSLVAGTLGLLVGLLPAMAAGQSVALFTPVHTSRAASEPLDDETLRFRAVTIDFARLQRVQATAAAARGQPAQTKAAAPPAKDHAAVPAPGTTLLLNLFDDVVLTGVVERTAPTFSGGYALSGRIVGEPFGDLTLVVNGETVAGTVRTQAGTYRIRSVGAGRYAVSEVAEPRLECEVLEPPVAEPGRHDEEPGPPAGVEARGASTRSETVIDVAIFYTPAVRKRKGGHDEIRTVIDEMVALTNRIYEQSGVQQRIAPVAVEEVVGYEERGTSGDVYRLANGSDGHMDEVHGVRDRVAADVVMLVRTSGGAAFLKANAGSAFGVTKPLGTTLAHELGHIMGLYHDRYVDCRSGGCKGYAFGYTNQRAFEEGAPDSTRWHTIMVIGLQCRDSGFSCRELHRFSNPQQVYPDPGGDPMGVPAGTQTADPVAGPADAVRRLNERRTYIASFRRAPALTVSFGAAQYEATEGGPAATVTVGLSGKPTRSVLIPLTATSSMGATVSDYTLSSTMLRFSKNQTERTVTVAAIDDAVDERDETVVLAFGAPLPRGVTAGSTTTVTLADDDTNPGPPRVLSVALTSNPGPGGAYGPGQEVAATVRFDKYMTVTGTPQLGLRVGGATRQANYRDSVDEAVRFVYIVADGDNDTDGVSIAANSLTPNGGTLRDDAQQNAFLDHAEVAAAPGHRVDSLRPFLADAVVDDYVLTLTYGEALNEAAVPGPAAFQVTADGVPQAVREVAVVGLDRRNVALLLEAPVYHGQVVTVGYTPGRVPLEDAVGNAVGPVAGRAVANLTRVPIHDSDSDGLIEITTLAQLNAVRYDLNGNGIPLASRALDYRRAFVGSYVQMDRRLRLVCAGACLGYELAADLDFDTNRDGQIAVGDDYWNGGYGWRSIDGFDAVFEGNGHTIRHLFIQSRGLYVGLFGSIGSSAVIRRVGLVGIDVTGEENVGGLVGKSAGSITASYATGRATGRLYGQSVVANIGGLVGESTGSITASYATGRVTGTLYEQSGVGNIGGLVGESTGSITASYATGRVTGVGTVGGLVGESTGSITASYATGRVTGVGTVGGLVGESTGGTITASYWDTGTSGQASGAEGRSTAQMQAPTGSTGLYAAWNVDSTAAPPWDFGEADEYPVLAVDFDGNGDATWQEFGYQLRESPTLMLTNAGGQVTLSWTAVDTDHWDPAPDVTYALNRDDGTTITVIAEDLSGTTATDTAVRVGTPYTSQVAAVVNGGEATRSGLVTVVATNTVLDWGGDGGGGGGDGGGGGGGGSGSGSGGGGSGGGGGGGSGGGGSPRACTQADVHGNSVAQATDIVLATETTGAICPTADVDYFTVTAPGRGLLFVDTTGEVQTRGIIWQNDVLLASGSTGRPPDARLGALVQAGTVVVAVQGQGGATGDYDVVVTFTPGYLENPGPESFQSGVGVLSGWVCDAEVVEIELNGVPQEAAYGTERVDTAGVCGDVDNGFGLLVNWNRLGAGEHTVVAYVDGVELGRATVRVTTVGEGAEEEFLRGAAGTCEAEDFPRLGERVTLVWQQTSQNFVIAGGSAPVGVNRAGVAGVGYLENPGPDSFQSGVGVISGWVCAADLVEVALNGVLQEAAYGTERVDTAGVCGDVDNGFGLLVNWNRLGEGEHEVVAYVDGVELGRATVRVTTVGEGAEEEFLRGAEGECVVEDFPALGQSVLLEWQQNSQNFVITDVE